MLHRGSRNIFEHNKTHHIKEKSLFHAIKKTKTEYSALDKASISKQSEAPSASKSSEPREWPCKVLQTWLKTRGFTYSGLRKAELIDKYKLQQGASGIHRNIVASKQVTSRTLHRTWCKKPHIHTYLRTHSVLYTATT